MAENWIQQASDALHDRLAPLRDLGCQVEQTPIGAAAYRMRLHGYYAGSTFSEPLLQQTLTQDEEVQFRFVLEFHDARGPQEAYPVLIETRRLLTGFQPLEGKCFWRGTQFTELDDGKWVYLMTLAFERVQYQER